MPPYQGRANATKVARKLQAQMTPKPLSLAIVALAAGLAGCTTADVATAPDFRPPSITRDAAGNCFGAVIVPAVIETRTEQVMLEPAQTDGQGNIVKPAVFGTRTVQTIVRERQEVSVEAVCPETMTAQFVASLQRAMQVRGLYQGAVTGRFDATTAAAVQMLQRQSGLDTPLLAVSTAKALGLVELDRDEL